MSARRFVVILTQMEGGGAQRAAMNLCLGLRNHGHDVELWFLYKKRSFYESYPWVKNIHDRPPGRALSYLLIWIKLIFRLHRFKPHGVVTFTHYSNVLGQLAALVSGVRMRIASQRNPGSSYPAAARIADRIIGSLGCYTYNVMVSWSTMESFADYPSQYKNRARVIPNGTLVSIRTPDKALVRERYRLPADSILVLNVGRLSYQKNQTTLLKAIASLPRVHLAIAGEGELRGELEAEVVSLGLSGRVTLLGELPNDQIPDLVVAADIFAFPSVFEGQSNALLEAITLGAAVIASNIGPNVEVLCHKLATGVGMTIPALNVAMWTKAIDLLANDPKERRRLSQLALTRSRDFTVDCMVNNFNQLLNSHDSRQAGAQ